MPYIDFYQRLEPRQPDWDYNRGVRAELGDPAWFLGRQWQMGELQGEDAGSPVRLQAWVARRRLDPVGGDPRWDPTRVPPEAIIESEPGDWWTIGRRVRYGVLFSKRVDVSGQPDACFLQRPPDGSRAYGTDLPAPYEQFSDAAGKRTYADGWVLWQRRAALGILEADFPEIPATEPTDLWQPDQLSYHAEFKVEGHTFTAERHPGGRVDWFTVDADTPFDPRALAPGALPEVDVFPRQLMYPGAPHSRYWEIEDASLDLGGYPPDTAHFPSMVLADLVSTHSTQWYLFPIDTQAGYALTIEKVIVTDGFGDPWSSDDYPELRPPTDWSLFRPRDRVQGDDFNTLVVWPTALSPLSGATLEEVILGVDEYADLLWAVERRVNTRDVRTPSAQERNKRPALPPQKPVNMPELDYRYLPAVDAVPYWYPYVLGDFGGQRRFIQARLVDYSGPVGVLMDPVPASHVLNDPRLAEPQPVHVIDPAAVPVDGLALERCWMLSRDTAAQPVLWVRRRRKPLLTPPSRHLRFDVMERIQ
jgi:hypothetical protein